MGVDRRSLLKGLFGIATTAAVVSLIPRQAEAFVGGAPPDTAPPSDNLPKLEPAPDDLSQGPNELDDGFERVYHRGRRHRRRRRRRRVRRWRRTCRRYRYRGRWRRGRCRRVPFWVWIWF